MANLKQKVDFTGKNIYIGIDVHLKQWNVSIYYESQFLTNFTQPPDPKSLVTYLKSNYPNAHYKCAYESGFCGFWIQRQLEKETIECIVVNAADVPFTNKSISSKTDTNDSKRIANALQANLLTPIFIPDEELEADRQLVRINEKYNNDLIRAKNRIKGFLYQLGIHIPVQFAKSNWSNPFITWLKELKFENNSIKIALNHKILMVETIKKQKFEALKDIRNLLKKERYNTVAKSLISVPGVGPYTAISLLTEIGDMNRFSNFEKLNSFIGYYPSQFSSGEKIHQGGIINRNHKRLRSLIIESAWVSIKTDPAMTKVYHDLKLKLGGKRAIIKIARKLLSRIRHVWLEKELYEKGIVK
jgi:transposase